MMMQRYEYRSCPVELTDDGLLIRVDGTAYALNEGLDRLGRLGFDLVTVQALPVNGGVMSGPVTRMWLYLFKRPALEDSSFDGELAWQDVIAATEADKRRE
jgi:hypothetical protein